VPSQSYNKIFTSKKNINWRGNQEQKTAPK